MLHTHYYITFRAEELEKDSSNPEAKYIAYYCLLFAVEKGIKVPTKDNQFLYSLMEKLEKDRVTYGIASIESEKVNICENFAFTVFNNADEEDRSGSPSGATAKAFYAAVIFFDILEQFGPLGEETLEKRKYAKWRAAELVKAAKEGRAPAPPPALEVSLIHLKCLHN